MPEDPEILKQEEDLRKLKEEALKKGIKLSKERDEIEDWKKRGGSFEKVITPITRKKPHEIDVEGLDELDRIIDYIGHQFPIFFAGHIADEVKRTIQEMYLDGSIAREEQWVRLADLTVKLRGGNPDLGKLIPAELPTTSIGAKGPMLVETGEMISKLETSNPSSNSFDIGYYDPEIIKRAVSHEFGADIKIFKKIHKGVKIRESIKSLLGGVLEPITWVVWRPLPQRKHLSPVVKHKKLAKKIVEKIRDEIEKDIKFKFDCDVSEE